MFGKKGEGMIKSHKREERFIRRFIRPLFIGCMVGLVCAVASSLGVFRFWSDRVSDRLFLDRAVDSRIVIVAIDDASLASVGRWPWTRSVHAELIRRISKAEPAVIAYDVNFSDRQSDSEDADLASAMIDAGTVVLPTEVRFIDKVSYDTARTIRPISVLSSDAVRTGFSNITPDNDGIVRRVPLFSTDTHGTGLIRAFGYESATVLERALKTENAPIDDERRLIVAFSGSPGESFPRVSAKDVLDGKVSDEVFKGKAVFVGSTAPDLHDEFLVPTSNGVLMPGVEIHASLANALLTRSWLVHFPTNITMMILFGLGLLFGLFVPFIRMRWSLLFSFVVWVGFIVASFIAFDRGWILDVVWPTLTIVGSFSGIVAEQRVTAERERRMMRHVFSQYVSPSVVESIMRDPKGLTLGGERRRMTVSFVDIRGFTTLTEHMDAAELVEMLNDYLDRMTKIVFKHEGVLDKYIGDAIMSFWNAPFDQPNHASLAVHAALDMRAALRQMNRARLFGGGEWKVGMGINTGDMIVGNMGGEGHAAYTVIGDSVNLASRLESLTKEYGVSIFIAQETADELHGEFLLRRVDRVRVQGRTEPVTVYELVESMDHAETWQKEMVRVFEEALDAYTSRHFDEAASLFDAFRSAHPEDVPARVIGDRARTFCTKPPPDAWDGTWVYTRK